VASYIFEPPAPEQERKIKEKKREKKEKEKKSNGHITPRTQKREHPHRHPTAIQPATQRFTTKIQ
jgi:hypothetical protein